MAVRTEPNEIVEGVHNRDRCFERERRQGAFVANFDVFVVPAANAPMRKRREVAPTSILPKASMPASRMVGAIGHGTNRLGSVQRSVGPVIGAIAIPSRDRTPTHGTATGGSSFR